ncbi:MAG: hypothetical protein DRR19_11355 [Candidatus Parabeggiatoa sp. nov. 1]|nr:MAG: hypothetical protein DRR19_11355 [Gammaproteobacteria bacterium]
MGPATTFEVGNKKTLPTLRTYLFWGRQPRLRWATKRRCPPYEHIYIFILGPATTFEVGNVKKLPTLRTYLFWGRQPRLRWATKRSCPPYEHIYFGAGNHV